MDWHGVILGFFVIVVVLHTVESLKCYTCSSILDDKCGVTWGFEDGQADKYLEECIGDPVLCRKLEYKLFPHEQRVVYRSCWNTTSIWTPPATECKDMTDGRTCYCDTGDTPCNGAQLLQNSVINIVFTVMSLGFIMVKLNR